MKLYKFQFLIGRLGRKLKDIYGDLPYVFQFLIGRLGTIGKVILALI